MVSFPVSQQLSYSVVYCISIGLPQGETAVVKIEKLYDHHVKYSSSMIKAFVYRFKMCNMTVVATAMIT